VKTFKIAFVPLIFVLLAACRNATEEPASPSLTDESASQPTATVVVATDAPAVSSESTTDPTPTTPDSTSTPLPEPTTPPTPQPPAEPEEVTVDVADGLTIFGTFYPGAGQGPWPAVMLLHMNGGQRSDWDAFARQLAGEGYAALAIDMRGHGDTGGQSDWELAADDLQQVWAYLTSREDVDETRAAIAGASIGANMSLVTGVEEPSVKTVIMLSPGLNYFDVTTDDRIVQYGNRPSLIVASEEDTLSADSSEELHELAMGENELVLYQGAGHGTNMFARKPELADLMIAWFDRHVKGEEPTADLPAPALFDVAWDDRSAFRQGLISSEAAVLDELPGASIYHLDLAISPDLLSVAGLQEVRYTNQEDVTLDEVYFHLYPNLLGGNLTVSGLTVNGEPMTPEYLDRAWTVMRVPLPAARIIEYFGARISLLLPAFLSYTESGSSVNLAR